MAGKIVADIIEAPAGRISLNVANVTVASINASGVFSSTGNLLITQAGTIGTGAITDGAVTTAKIAPSAIVGTVSQSGGVPTGAIIERGSNANGEFVKYADGTMVCTFTSSTVSQTTNAVGNGFRSADITFTFPVAYVAIPVVALGCQFVTGTSALSPETNGPTFTTGFSARLNGWDNTTQGQIRYISVGRWF